VNLVSNVDGKVDVQRIAEAEDVFLPDMAATAAENEE
jgi:hypothetical protein